MDATTTRPLVQPALSSHMSLPPSSPPDSRDGGLGPGPVPGREHSAQHDAGTKTMVAVPGDDAAQFTPPQATSSSGPSPTLAHLAGDTATNGKHPSPLRARRPFVNGAALSLRVDVSAAQQLQPLVTHAASSPAAAAPAMPTSATAAASSGSPLPSSPMYLQQHHQQPPHSAGFLSKSSYHHQYPHPNTSYQHPHAHAASLASPLDPMGVLPTPASTSAAHTRRGSAAADSGVFLGGSPPIQPSVMHMHVQQPGGPHASSMALHQIDVLTPTSASSSAHGLPHTASAAMLQSPVSAHFPTTMGAAAAAAAAADSPMRPTFFASPPTVAGHGASVPITPLIDSFAAFTPASPHAAMTPTQASFAHAQAQAQAFMYQQQQQQQQYRAYANTGASGEASSPGGGSSSSNGSAAGLMQYAAAAAATQGGSMVAPPLSPLNPSFPSQFQQQQEQQRRMSTASYSAGVMQVNAGTQRKLSVSASASLPPGALGLSLGQQANGDGRVQHIMYSPVAMTFAQAQAQAQAQSHMQQQQGQVDGSSSESMSPPMYAQPPLSAYLQQQQQQQQQLNQHQQPIGLVSGDYFLHAPVNHQQQQLSYPHQHQQQQYPSPGHLVAASVPPHLAMGQQMGPTTIVVPSSAHPITIPAPAMRKRTDTTGQEVDGEFEEVPPMPKEEHPCPECGKTFAKAFNLKSHMKSHVTERPYHCQWPHCTKSFTRKHDCIRHFRIHTTVSPRRPLACPAPSCARRFSRQSALDRHLKESPECAHIGRMIHMQGGTAQTLTVTQGRNATLAGAQASAMAAMHAASAAAAQLATAQAAEASDEATTAERDGQGTQVSPFAAAAAASQTPAPSAAQIPTAAQVYAQHQQQYLQQQQQHHHPQYAQYMDQHAHPQMPGYMFMATPAAQYMPASHGQQQDTGYQAQKQQAQQQQQQDVVSSAVGLEEAGIKVELGEDGTAQ